MTQPPPLDRQSLAYRQAGEQDHWDDDIDAVVAAGGHAHAALSDLTPIRPPEDWEVENWDAGRQPAKTIEEARAALQARVDDPGAPDDDPHAYDDDTDD